jgi:hypothetical protein
MAASITAGQAEAEPGAQLILPVTLAPDAEDAVAAIQFELSFDTSVATFLDATAGESATAAGKDLSVSLLEDGTVRVIIAGLNADAMDSGVVAYVSLQADAAATPGDYPASFAGVLASDVYATPINCTGISGTITIQPEKTVPSVVGYTRSNADFILSGVGYLLGAISFQYSTEVAQDLIISQEPVAGTAAEAGTSVSIVVSYGPQPVLVPNLENSTQTEAEEALVAVGLVLGTVSSEHSDTIEAGLVLAQDPVVGESVFVGDSINVTLSLGPVEGEPVEGAIEGALPEGAPLEGSPVEGEPPLEGEIPVEGEIIEGQPAEGLPVEGEVPEGSLPEGEILEGAPLEGQVEEGSLPEGAPVEGQPLEGEIPVEGNPVEGEIPAEGAPLEGAPPEGAVLEGEPLEGEAVEGSLPEGELAEGEAVESEIAEGDVVEGQAVDGEIVEGQVADGEIPEGAVAEGEPVPEEREGQAEGDAPAPGGATVSCFSA